MKIPVKPPTLEDVLSRLREPKQAQRFAEVLADARVGLAPEGRYRHWETLRRIPPPEGLTSEEWWAAIKFWRSRSRRHIPLVDAAGKPFHYTTPDPMLELLHEIDRDASGRIAVPESIANPHTKARYLQSSLIEEAITSSQLEGAAATREQAKEMIRHGRKPADRAERMILNNYRAMQRIGEVQHRPLTEELIFEVHQTISEQTLPEGTTPPYLRETGDGIAVYDGRDNRLLHSPPPASQIAQRMAAMCEFANTAQTGIFLHPVVKAIILHFWLAYDHPFVDGNGRTARALFYWSMLSQGYWLTEFVSISSILRSAPSKYGRSFLYTETDENDLTYFILYQLRVLRRAIGELHAYLARKMEEVHKTEKILRASVELNHRQLALLSHALRHPGTRYSIASHRKSHGVSYQTARTDLLNLESMGLLTRTRSGKTYVFAAEPDLYERLQALQ